MNLETSVAVTKVQDVKAEDDFVTITIKGTKTVVLEGYLDGYDLEDTAEISMTVRVRTLAAAKYLGIDKFGATKILSLKDRDATLQSFAEIELHPGRDGVLSKYEGIVSEDVLNKIESVVPAKLLEEIA